VFLRELSSKLYSLSIYYFTKNLVEMPVIFVSPLV
jgi:ABC-type multidrug transport system permease subunit